MDFSANLRIKWTWPHASMLFIWKHIFLNINRDVHVSYFLKNRRNKNEIVEQQKLTNLTHASKKFKKLKNESGREEKEIKGRKNVYRMTLGWVLCSFTSITTLINCQSSAVPSQLDWKLLWGSLVSCVEFYIQSPAQLLTHDECALSVCLSKEVNEVSRNL